MNDAERMAEILKFINARTNNPFMVLSAFRHGVKIIVSEYHDHEMKKIDKKLDAMWNRWIADLCKPRKDDKR